MLLREIKKVAVGLSGGVDSAVAALLLKRKGFETVGVFMKNWDVADETGHCSVESEMSDAEDVSKFLGIQFKVVNFVKEYWNEVFTELVSQYQAGLTPNPDILCNKYIKFHHFSNYAFKNLGCDAIATGHYAQNTFGEYLENKNNSGAYLLKAVDTTKDQTFFLSQISQESLQKAMFPLGLFTKDLVKKMAFEQGLKKISMKKESTGICFIGKRNFQQFIAEYVKPDEGNFIDVETGEIVGTHLGKHNYTLGQRCYISGTKKPYYIAMKTKTQDIVVAMGHDHPLLCSSNLLTLPPHWIHSLPIELQNCRILSCDFKFQHGKELFSCDVFGLDDGGLAVFLNKPIRALTPGQYAVFYKGNVCLGSAPIRYVGPTEYALNYSKELSST